MNSISEQRMKLRIDYTNETKELIEDNIPKYADWLEIKLAQLETYSFQKCIECGTDEVITGNCCNVCGAMQK